jgi:hypothetical protein
LKNKSKQKDACPFSENEIKEDKLTQNYNEIDSTIPSSSIDKITLD